MTKQEAIEALAEGHSMYDVEYARKVCKALGVKFNEKLGKPTYSDPPGTHKGLTMNPGCEGMVCVGSLQLSYWVAKQLGVESKADSYHGRGSQARAYASEVAKVI